MSTATEEGQSMTAERAPRVVRQYRQANSRLRDLAARGGRTRATTYAVERHQRTLTLLELELVGSRRQLLGSLSEEAELLRRLGLARAAGMRRPELEARLAGARRSIREELAR